VGVSVIWLLAVVMSVSRTTYGKPMKKEKKRVHQDVIANATDKITRGQKAFRFDTFGDQAFWGDTLKLHQAIEGAGLGGVGPGVSPKGALSVGLKVDIDALPGHVREQIEKGRVNLNDPAVTVALLQMNAVLGITGVFSGG